MTDFHHMISDKAVEIYEGKGWENKVLTIACENAYVARAVSLVAYENWADAERVAHCMNEFYQAGKRFRLD